jgi:hypothetical protein
VGVQRKGDPPNSVRFAAQEDDQAPNDTAGRLSPLAERRTAMNVLGGVGAIAGGLTAMVAGILLAAFFATRRDAIGRANDAASALMAILLVPPALAVLGRLAEAGPFITVVTGVGLLGMMAATVASVLTAAGRLTVAQLTTWQGGSFIVLFAWVVGVSVAIVLWDGLPVGLGWLGVATGVLVVIATVEVIRLARRMGGLSALEKLDRPPMLAMAATLAAFAVFPIWCVWLGLGLMS